MVHHPRVGISPRELLDACAALEVEGVVAKRVDSLYRPVVRSGDWLTKGPAQLTSAVRRRGHPRYAASFSWRARDESAAKAKSGFPQSTGRPDCMGHEQVAQASVMVSVQADDALILMVERAGKCRSSVEEIAEAVIERRIGFDASAPA